MKEYFIHKIVSIILCGILFVFGFGILQSSIMAEEIPNNCSYSICEKDLIDFINEHSFSELFGIQNYNSNIFDNPNIMKYFQEKKYSEVIKLINEEIAGVELLPDWPGSYTKCSSTAHYMVKAASFESLGKTSNALAEILEAQQEYDSAILYLAKLVLDVKLDKKQDIVDDFDKIKNEVVINKPRLLTIRSLNAEDPINWMLTHEINIKIDFIYKLENIKKCNSLEQKK